MKAGKRPRPPILSGEYFLVVCDEITYPLVYGWLPIWRTCWRHCATARDEVHVCLTGRRCPQEIVACADTVTEMRPIKHAFDAGIPAQRGIEDSAAIVNDMTRDSHVHSETGGAAELPDAVREDASMPIPRRSVRRSTA